MLNAQISDIFHFQPLCTHAYTPPTFLVKKSKYFYVACLKAWLYKNQSPLKHGLLRLEVNDPVVKVHSHVVPVCTGQTGVLDLL